MPVLSSSVPRQCGIATFCSDLCQAIAEVLGGHEATVLAMGEIADKSVRIDAVEREPLVERLLSNRMTP